jgi:hypothetical protein
MNQRDSQTCVRWQIAHMCTLRRLACAARRLMVSQHGHIRERDANIHMCQGGSVRMKFKERSGPRESEEATELEELISNIETVVSDIEEFQPVSTGT